MISKTLSGAVIGIEAMIVEVQCDVSRGMPKFKMVGLPEKEVKESEERIRSAIKNSGFSFPTRRITANLAPADQRKEGVGLDLPIACGILEASEQVQPEGMENVLLIGELSLDGEVRPVSGVLPVALEAAEKESIEGLIVPEGNAREAALVGSLDVYPVSSLTAAVDLFQEEERSPIHFDRERYFELKEGYREDFSDVKGQQQAKRALEIAAAGGHNVLLSGPPGSGKSMLAKRLPTILPRLTFEEALSATKIYSIMGELGSDTPLITTRQVRSPHHTISYAGMVGGGHGNPSPGEISLAHKGVLFLDELPEFSRKVLETLRQPLEEGSITIARSSTSVRFPADFTLIAAMNPCPCGYLGDPVKRCRCRPHEIRRYRKKISGPFLDRIDIFVDVQRLKKEEMLAKVDGESSSQKRERVKRGREKQRLRFDRADFHNSEMGPSQVEEFCNPESEASELLEGAIDRFGFSARSYHKVLKVGRTVADLAGSSRIGPEHISEAIQYRTFKERLLNGEGV